MTGFWTWFRPTRDTLAGPPLNHLLFGGSPAAVLLLGVSGLIFRRAHHRADGGVA